MIKKKTYNIADTNCALIGSDLDKKVKLAAAKTEKAWTGAGKSVGLKIWRIEKFKVVAVDKKDYGSFYSGDSYILLRTYKKEDKIKWDIHFWLGGETTQDEAGTAAYKTVELDDFLGGEPVQHREVEAHESALFLGYFKKQGGIRIMEGGIESGFNHVKPTEYKARLLQLKGKKNIRVTQVSLTTKSLNCGDVFILDCGMRLYQWMGKRCSGKERVRAGQLSRAIDDERGGKPEVEVYTQGDKDIPEIFWKTLGATGPVDITAEGEDDAKWEKSDQKVLFQFSDSTGEEKFTKKAEGKITKSMLDSKDVFILDVGSEIFVWIGSGASTNERKKAMGTAQQYLLKNEARPNWLPISRVLQGGENEVFNSYFDG